MFTASLEQLQISRWSYINTTLCAVELVLRGQTLEENFGTMTADFQYHISSSVLKTSGLKIQILQWLILTSQRYKESLKCM